MDNLLRIWDQDLSNAQKLGAITSVGIAIGIFCICLYLIPNILGFGIATLLSSIFGGLIFAMSSL